MELGNLSVSVGADIATFEAGMAQVQADLGKVAAAADAAAGRYTDANGRMREANGRFVSAATLAAEAAGRLGGSLGTVSDAANKAGASINSGLVANFAAFDAKVKPLNEGIGRLGEGLKGLGGGLTAGVTIPLGLLGGASLKMAGDLEVAKVAFTTMLGSAQAATQTLDELKQFAADTPFEFPEIQNAAKKLLAFNTPAKDLKETLRQLGDISSGIGAPIGEIADLFGKARVQGRLFQEDINQLTGRGIPIIQELAKQFNVTEDGVRKLVESGKVNFGNLQTAFANLTKEGGKFGGLMAAQSETIPGLFSTLSDNAGQALATLGQEIAKSLNLKGVITDLSAFVKSAADAFRSLSPGAKDFAVTAGLVAASLGPIAYGLGTVLTALPALEAGLAVLGTTTTAALGPIGIGIAAVAAGAYLIINNWDDLVAYFTSGEGGRVFGDLAESISNSVGVIRGAFNDLGGEGNFGDLISASGTLKALFRDIAVGITAISDVAGGSIGAVSALFSGDLTEAAGQAERALYGLIDPIANLLGFSKKAPTDSGIYILTQQAKEFNAVGPQFAANLALLNGVRLDALTEQANAAAKQVGLLQSLEDKLKAAKDAKPALTNEADIAASNRLIASLEAQIKRLNELGIGSKKANEAVTKLREELARLTALDGLLGDAPSEMQVLERRADTLSAGLKKLVEAGVSTSSRAFQSFAQDLVTTSQAFDRLAGKASGLELKAPQIKGLPTKIGDTLQADVARLLGDYALKPLELKFPLKLQPVVSGLGEIQGGIQDGLLSAFKGFDTKGLGAPLLEYSQALSQAGDTAKVFGGNLGAALSGFDVAGQKADAARAYLEALREQGFGALSPVVLAAAANLRQFGIESENTKILAGAISDSFAALGASIGTAVGDGSSVLAGALAGLIDVLSDYAAKKGKLLIADGTADLFTPGLQAVGALKIAGGVGLLVAAGVARAGGASLTKPSGGSVSSPSASYGISSSANSQASIPKEITLRLRGQDAVAILSLQGYRSQKTN